MSKKFVWLGVIALCFCLTQSLSAARADDGVKNNEILIGVVGIYTGPVSYLGDAQAGGLMVFDEVNKNGGIYGRKLVLQKEDTAFSPAKTIGAVKKLIYRDKVFALWGTVGSSPAIAAKPEVDGAKVPWIETTSTDRKLTNPASRYLFTCQDSSFHEATGIAKYILGTLKSNKIAIIHDSSGYGLNQSTFIIQHLKENGISLLAQETYQAGDTDFSSQVLKVREVRPDVTIISGYSREIGHIIRQSMELGLKTQFITVSAGSDALARDIASKEAYAGVISATCLKGVLGSGTETLFEKQFKVAYPDLAQRPNRPSLNDALTYHSAMVMVEALKRAGKDLTREGFVKALESIRDYETSVMTTTFTPEEHCGMTWVNFQKWLPDGSAKIIATKIESKD